MSEVETVRRCPGLLLHPQSGLRSSLPGDSELHHGPGTFEGRSIRLYD